MEMEMDMILGKVFKAIMNINKPNPNFTEVLKAIKKDLSLTEYMLFRNWSILDILSVVRIATLEKWNKDMGDK